MSYEWNTQILLLLYGHTIVVWDSLTPAQLEKIFKHLFYINNFQMTIIPKVYFGWEGSYFFFSRSILTINNGDARKTLGAFQLNKTQPLMETPIVLHAKSHPSLPQIWLSLMIHPNKIIFKLKLLLYYSNPMITLVTQSIVRRQKHTQPSPLFESNWKKPDILCGRNSETQFVIRSWKVAVSGR